MGFTCGITKAKIQRHADNVYSLLFLTAVYNNL